MKKRALLYARVSGDDRERDSLGGQLELCRAYAESRGYVVVRELAEDEWGVSGADVEAAELNRAIELGAAGDFDVLVCREMDRLARSLAKQMIVEDRLKRAGVVIEYALASYDDTPEGQLQKLVRASVAEYERLKIVERMERGRRRAVQRGNVLVAGQAPYGYYVEEVGGHRTLAIAKEEAAVVRQIFEWYCYGDNEDAHLSMRAIALKLSARGVPTPADLGKVRARKERGYGNWCPSTIGGILRNDTYLGTWTYNTSDGEAFSVEIPQIIDRDTFKAATRQRRKAKQLSPRNLRYAERYLLRGRVRCGRCGYVMEARRHVQASRRMTKKGPKTYRYTYFYYRCSAGGRPTKARGACQARVVRVDDLDAAVWALIVDLFAVEGKLDAAYNQLLAGALATIEPLAQQVEMLDNDVARLEARRERLLDIYLDGGSSTGLYRERLAEIEERLAETKGERAVAKERLEALDDSDVYVTLREFATVVKDQIGATADYGGRRWYVDTLDVEATVHAVKQDRRRVTVTAHGVSVGETFL